MVPDILIPAGPEVARQGARFSLTHDWGCLEADSHRPEVQDMIRRLVRKGIARVCPFPDDPTRIRLIPGPQQAPV